MKPVHSLLVTDPVTYRGVTWIPCWVSFPLCSWQETLVLCPGWEIFELLAQGPIGEALPESMDRSMYFDRLVGGLSAMKLEPPSYTTA